MRLDGADVDQPVGVGAAGERLLKFAGEHARIVGAHGEVVGGLQVVKRDVIIHAVEPRLPLRHGRNAGIEVSVAPVNHAAIAVVRPDLDDFRGHAQVAGAVQARHFAVDVGAKKGVGVMRAHDFHLPGDNAGNHPASLRRCVKALFQRPKRLVALRAVAHGPDHPSSGQAPRAFLPQRFKQLRVLRIGRPHARIGAGEHARAQELGVVLRQP